MWLLTAKVHRYLDLPTVGLHQPFQSVKPLCTNHRSHKEIRPEYPGLLLVDPLCLLGLLNLGSSTISAASLLCFCFCWWVFCLCLFAFFFFFLTFFLSTSLVINILIRCWCYSDLLIKVNLNIYLLAYGPIQMLIASVSSYMKLAVLLLYLVSISV